LHKREKKIKTYFIHTKRKKSENMKEWIKKKKLGSLKGNKIQKKKFKKKKPKKIKKKEKKRHKTKTNQAF
jgi:hypothetical protein